MKTSMYNGFFPMISPSWGPISNPSPGFWTPRTAPFLEDRFCGRWRLQPFSSDGHPVFARYDCSEKGALGRSLAVDRWGTAKDQINSGAGTSQSGDKSQILGGNKNSRTGGRQIFGWFLVWTIVLCRLLLAGSGQFFLYYRAAQKFLGIAEISQISS